MNINLYTLKPPARGTRTLLASMAISGVAVSAMTALLYWRAGGEVAVSPPPTLPVRTVHYELVEGYESSARYLGQTFERAHRFEPDEDTVLLLHFDHAVGVFHPDHSDHAAHAVSSGEGAVLIEEDLPPLDTD